MLKPKNDPLKNVEKIVQLQTARRPPALAVLPIPRVQLATPVLFESWTMVRDQAAAALLGGSKRMVLTGPAGTGKTVLIEHVARVLRAAGRTVVIQLANADPAPPAAGVTLFVDEADRLPAAKLVELVEKSAGTVVLTGLEAVARRVTDGTLKLTLEPLDQTQARDYIAEWLALNGRIPAELDSKAVRALAELSGGVPRLLSTLLATASWLATSSDAPVIQAVHIHEAAELRSVLTPSPVTEIPELGPPPARRHRAAWSALLTGVVLAGTAVAVAPRLFPAETDRLLARLPAVVQMAERWIGREQPTQMISLASPPMPAKPAPPPVRPAPVAVAPPPEPIRPPVETPPPEPVQAVAEPAMSVPPPEVKPPEVTTPEMVAQVPPTVAVPVVVPPPPLPIGTIVLLLRRGREMLAIDDVSAARLLFLRAAEGGSAEAMFELGQTYDPNSRLIVGTIGQADRAEAERWYRRAASVGNHNANEIQPKP